MLFNYDFRQVINVQICLVANAAWHANATYPSREKRGMCGRGEGGRVAGKVFGVATINLCNASQGGGQTCAQLHEHFVAAHMKYACNFEFAIHLNVFLITFSAAAAAAATTQLQLQQRAHK